MKTKLILLICIISAYSIADENTIDFESAVEEFTEATIETTPIDFTDPTAAYSSLQLGYSNEALMPDLDMLEQSMTIGRD